MFWIGWAVGLVCGICLGLVTARWLVFRLADIEGHIEAASFCVN